MESDPGGVWENRLVFVLSLLVAVMVCMTIAIIINSDFLLHLLNGRLHNLLVFINLVT